MRGTSSAGLDALVQRGVADPDRIGVMGGSYGGFMAAWLPTVDGRFQAAVSASPVTDWYSERFDSTLGSWAADLRRRGTTRRCPRLTSGRARCSRRTSPRPPSSPRACTTARRPSGQATEFYRALRGRGVPAEVVRYPQEGHGVRNFPALIDFVTRTVGWFERFMPAGCRLVPRTADRLCRHDDPRSTRGHADRPTARPDHEGGPAPARRRVPVGSGEGDPRGARRSAGDDQRSKIDIMRPLALLNDLVRDTDEGALGEALRPMYVDYLEHAATTTELEDGLRRLSASSCRTGTSSRCSPARHYLISASLGPVSSRSRAGPRRLHRRLGVEGRPRPCLDRGHLPADGAR